MSFPGSGPEETKRKMEEIRRRQEELAKQKRRGVSIADAVREAEETAKQVRDGIVDDYDNQ